MQDENVTKTLQQMTFITGDLQGSMKNLNLTYDLAYQKGVDVSEAAMLVSKAFTGNVEMLGRYIPELRNLNDTLGKNATTTQKAAYAMALLEEKSAGALSKMTEHERAVKEMSKAWLDFKEIIGGIAIEQISDFLNVGKDILSRTGAIHDTSKDLTTADINYSKGKETPEQMAARIKAINDSIISSNAGEKAALMLKSWAQDTTKLFTPDDKILAAWDNYYSELSKIDTQYEKIKTDFKEMKVFEIEYQKAAIGYQNKINNLYEQHSKVLEQLKNTSDRANLDKQIKSFETLAETEKKSISERIEAMKSWRDVAYQSYQDAINKAKEYKTLAESINQTIEDVEGRRQRLFGKSLTPQEQMGQGAEKLQGLFEKAQTPQDFQTIATKTMDYLEQFKGMENVFGGYSAFEKVKSLQNDVLDKMKDISFEASLSENAWNKYTNSAVNSINTVDQWVIVLQTRVDYLNTIVAQSKEIKIETSGAMEDIEALIARVLYLQSLLAGTSTGGGGTGGLPKTQFEKDVKEKFPKNELGF